MDAAQRGKRDGILPATVESRGRTGQPGRDLTTAPILVTALFGDADFAWLDGLRRAHFPPERNQVPAHLTLFHHLPPSVTEELHQRLKAEAADMPAPAARIAGLLDLGGGVALRVQCDGLEAIRARLAEAFAGLLTPQDRSGWRPHVTIQNKADRATAKALHAALVTSVRLPRPLAIAGLASWRYLGGPWDPIRTYRFR